MRIWTYVMTVDAGAAPNLEPPLATFAVCKPRIRLGANPGDAILAFTGRRLSPEPNAVCWAGIISEKLLFEEYWSDSRFDGKKPRKAGAPDNIYRPIKGRLVQVPNQTHRPEDFTRDTNGQYVLVIGQYWYFGPGGPILPKHFGLRMTGGRRGHRKGELSDVKWHKLTDWLDRQSSGQRRFPGVQRKRPKTCGPSRTC